VAALSIVADQTQPLAVAGSDSRAHGPLAPLLAGSQRFWFLEQLDPGNPALMSRYDGVLRK
jgi:hypothetical protein